jgi:hypothetical protein
LKGDDPRRETAGGFCFGARRCFKSESEMSANVNMFRSFPRKRESSTGSPAFAGTSVMMVDFVALKRLLDCGAGCGLESQFRAPINGRNA